eukprot:COSAG02_NODE_8511_length_2542_cov_5.641424_3_plen_114_part_00
MRNAESAAAAGVNKVSYTPVQQPRTAFHESENTSRTPDPLETGEPLCCGCPPIEPKGSIRKGWDALILGTIAWVMVVIPVRCGTNLHSNHNFGGLTTDLMPLSVWSQVVFFHS